jgi:hypothetical protein
MVLLLLRNIMWAAWWPYATMLLALEKAAQQQERAKTQASMPRSSQPQPPGKKEQLCRQEDRTDPAAAIRKSSRDRG